MTDHTQHPDGGDADMHGLSGAYAVDALDDLERARFEQHLAQCSDCRAEVAELRETAALLATDEVAPPPDLRDAVLAGIASVRPLPPEVGEERREDARPSVPSRRGWSGNLVLVAASIVLLALVAGALWLRPWADDAPGDDTTATPSLTDRVLDADDAQRVRQEFPDGSAATVVLSRSEGRAVIVTEDMAGAPDGKVYEIWLQSPDGPMEPAGLMPDDPDTTLLLDGDAAEATAVGITVEPDGGSPEPTSEPIALFALDA